MMSLKLLPFYNLGHMVGSSGGYLNVVGNLIELAGNAIRDVPLMLPDNNINFKSPFLLLVPGQFCSMVVKPSLRQRKTTVKNKKFFICIYLA